MISIRNLRLFNKKTALSVISSGLIGFVAGHYSADRPPAVAGKKNQHSSPALSAASEAEQVSYVCPMHPEIVADQPGDCPICGMPLVAHTHAHTPQNSAFPAVKISPTVAHNLGVRLAQAHTGTCLLYTSPSPRD